MVSGGGTVPIVMEKVAVAVAGVDWESFTCTVKLTVPLAVGVPEITPPAFSCNPAGKLLPDARDHV